MAVPDASPRPDNSASQSSIRPSASCLPSEGPAPRSSVRPRSEIVASKSEKNALAMTLTANPDGADDHINLRRRQAQSSAPAPLEYPLSPAVTIICSAYYLFSTNSVGVRPVTWRNAWEKAGTLA